MSNQYTVTLRKAKKKKKNVREKETPSDRLQLVCCF